MPVYPITPNTYSPCSPYCAPVGRLPVLGKMRAEIDQIRYNIVDVQHQIDVRQIESDMNSYRTQIEMSVLGDKANAEITLLKQKAVTELSQTCDYIPNGMGRNNVTNVQGIIDKQKLLFAKQTDGFDRDAEQKLAKIMVDTWSVRQTTMGESSDGAGVGNAEILRVLGKAKTGINY